MDSSEPNELLKVFYKQRRGRMDRMFLSLIGLVICHTVPLFLIGNTYVNFRGSYLHVDEL